jgi:hypothetical protein
MGLASYEIIGDDAEWRVRHDGKAENVYETRRQLLKPQLPQLLSLCGKATKCAFPPLAEDWLAGRATTDARDS